MKTAMRAKDSERLGTIRLLLAAHASKKKSMSAWCWTTSPWLPSWTSWSSSAKTALPLLNRAARHDLADREKSEMAVLQTYLPQRMSAEETQAAVQGHRGRAGRQRPRRHGQSDGRG